MIGKMYCGNRWAQSRLPDQQDPEMPILIVCVPNHDYGRVGLPHLCREGQSQLAHRILFLGLVTNLSKNQALVRKRNVA